MLVNLQLCSSIIPVSELEAASARPGIEKFVAFGEIAGLNVMPAPLAGTMRLDNLDEKWFILLRRDLEHDTLQLVTIGKELSFRLTDHLSEYAFQQYSAVGDAWQLRNIKPRQDMLLAHEGFADYIKAAV